MHRYLTGYISRKGLDVVIAALIGLALSRQLVAPSSSVQFAPVRSTAIRPRQPTATIIIRAYRETIRDRVPEVSAGVAFFAMLSLFPALAVLVSSFGLFASPSDIADLLVKSGTLLPAAANDLVRDQILKLAAADKVSLSLTWLGALAFSLWSASSATKAFMDALNVAYGVADRRSYIRYNATALLLTLGAVVMVVVLLLAFAVVPLILSRLWLGWASETLITYSRWPVLFAALVTGIALLYRFGPDVANARWRWITPGSLLASSGLMVFSFAFSWYAAKFAHYNETYGSLGAAIAFMTWAWLSTGFVLIGAELNAEIDRETAPLA